MRDEERRNDVGGLRWCLDCRRHNEIVDKIAGETLMQIQIQSKARLFMSYNASMNAKGRGDAGEGGRGHAARATSSPGDGVVA